jgi:hypothetical protein
MDVSEFLESEYLTVELARTSKSKQFVILSEGVTDTYKDKPGLKLLVEIDGKQKFWKPNKMNLQALSNKWGKDSKSYVGKVVPFAIASVQGRESILVQVS